MDLRAKPASTCSNYTLLLPRLVLEVSKNDKICVACNSPDFVNSNGNLNVKDLEAHAKARLHSSHFAGFVLCPIVASEDKVSTFDMYYHVIQERTVLYRPQNTVLTEMCCIISALENCVVPSASLLIQYLDRANQLFNRHPSRDSLFLLGGVKTLISTLMHWHGFQHPDVSQLPRGLQSYELYKDLESFDAECKDLMLSMFCKSFKLGDWNEENEQLEAFTFNLFYSPTILTKHFKSKIIISSIKEACLLKDCVLSLI
ncbi:ORF42 [Alcelaphine gammaherpesvirus 1]|uniref:Cytoplasmic envelopment protein 1 n=1 Tax=Alcelaphine herpesvirus 1 (strain C500) TaxID=654901 RepID=CEP1_ALHV1|nr:ORF42 [Alcelaphine gammaherpesvirus 1]O36391.1 RecName: Full=Cytoplasmic envelopment protein 1 [Alcelaphine herpesvirus 1 strain C500]AAC58088.1 ORF42 [Alcelaphine gammaherpesvirus 1]APB09466.1 tegument protein UL7 [Alcelaphine gammaherpesvirus 1]APB09538.1 tegument protein UL7 [Alcelaphine gammaherpesvirus 1]ATI21929.1 ORF42 [Alcelaphine gammaherpesvirus 1]QDY92274.1 tegument protein UL7 [Alcelaphine gammaherpesvirus 1]